MSPRREARSAIGVALLAAALAGDPASAAGPAVEPSPVPTAAPASIVVVRVKVTRDGAEIGNPVVDRAWLGDHIRTGPGEAAKILYPDGSVLFLGEGSDVVVSQNTGEGYQANRVYEGRVRGVIAHELAAVSGADGDAIRVSQAAAAAPRAAPGTAVVEALKKPRFVVRTKSATMGVRGTDFVLEHTTRAARTDIRTLDGVVEVGSSDAEVMGGKGTQLASGQQVSGVEGKGVGEKANFDVDAYRKSLAAKEAAWSKLSAPTDGLPAGAYQSAAAVPLPDAGPPPEPLILNFELGAIAMGQPRKDVGGSLATLQAAWTPVLSIFPWLAVRARAGLAIAKDEYGDKFPILDAGIGPSLRLGLWYAEAGVGAQYWKLDYNPFGGEAYATIGRRLQGSGALDRLFLGATAFNGPDKLTSPTLALRVGAGVRF